MQGRWRKGTDMKLGSLGSSPSPSTSWLCDLGQGTAPLWASFAGLMMAGSTNARTLPSQCLTQVTGTAYGHRHEPELL